jgi:hypothetical protein
MAEELVGWVYDCEANDLYLQATECWYIKFKTFDGSREMSVYPFREGVQKTYNRVVEWINSFPDGAHVGGFNHLGYDNWLIWKLFDIVPRVGKQGKDWLEGKHVQFIDGYILSQYLSPDNPKHSLDYLSNGSENDDEGKINYRQSLIEVGALAKDAPKGAEFKFFHELLVPYCDRDVDSTITVLKRQWAKAQEMYGKDKWLHPSFRQLQKDYWLYSAQAYTGVLFQQDRAKALIAHVEIEMAKLKAEVDPKLPPRPLKTAEQAFYKMPAKPYSKAGEESAALSKWLEKHSAFLHKGIVHAYDLQAPLVANAIFPVQLPMEIDDNQELKNWFCENGWVASEGFWNFKKDPATGKNFRDDKGKLVQTTPKIQNQGQICPNLLKLEGEIPAKVVKFLSYRNRLGVVTGWLNNWRMEFDGRLSAEISGYAPTSRVKHRVLTNCPKADVKVLLGAEMRDLFTVPDGYWYGGIDAAALENRTLSHHTFRYDDGKFARMQTEGDPHSFNAFAFFPKLHDLFDINDQENKENPLFKPWRNKAKTGAYLLAFGGGAPKLASSLGLSKKEGQASYDNYWEMNAGLGMLKTAVEKYYSTTGKNKYVPAIDGRLVSVRGKNVLLSCLGQGTGAIAMSYAACFMDNWLGEFHLDSKGRPYYIFKGKEVRRLSMVHDEFSWEIEDGVQEEVVKMAENAIVEAGKALKLALPLAAEGKMSFNGSWKDVH